MKPTNIFHDASIKLASLYVLIIMTISLLFTFWLYNLSMHEIRRGVGRIPGPIQKVLLADNPNFAREFRESQEAVVDEARTNLIYQLAGLNIVIALTGTTASYYLARRSLRPIERAHEAQTRFTSDASHELRTPIAAMRLENEIALLDDTLNVSQARQQFTSNIEELDKLTHLTEGLLQLARLENNVLEKTDVVAYNITKQAITRVRKNHLENLQKIIIEGDKKVTVPMNVATALEALVTVIENAVAYSPIESIVTLKITAYRNFVDVLITDTGTGIAEADQPHIFDRFYRASNARSKQSATQGYGIGLSLAQAIMHAHGGDIRLLHTSPEGSTFALRFPK